MLHCIYSNNLNVLKQVIVRKMQQEALTDPLQAEQILVPGSGLSQWLKLNLADDLGVASNIDYPMPSSFLWRLFHTVLDDVPEKSEFNKEALIWHIMAILPNHLNREEFQPLKNYLKDNSQLRLFQLSAKIADVFDQYLLYRPDWMNHWWQGGNLAADQQLWQPELWRVICERVNLLSGRGPKHRAVLFEQLVSRLEQDRAQLADQLDSLPSRIFLFGFSNLPPIYLKLIELLAQYKDIYLLVASPCRFYWGDVRTSAEQVRNFERLAGAEKLNRASIVESSAYNQSLLAALGKQGKEFLGQLQELPAEEVELYIDYGREQLLQQVQQDILDGEDRSAALIFETDSKKKQPINKTDFSISFHSHYSPLREVEVLHDQLLHLFEQDNGLTPKDIVVMVPDIDRYSPYIHAIFSNANLIPFSVADRSIGSEAPLLLRLKDLLQLPVSRLTANEVLELLELEAVRKRFGFINDDMQTIHQWVRDSGIRWGIDGNHRRSFDLPDFEQNSWRFGLRRMLAGYSMGGQAIFQGIASYDEVNGISADLAGKLSSLLDALESYRVELGREKKIDDWIYSMHRMTDTFFELGDDDDLTLQSLWNSLEKLKQNTELANYDEFISHTLFSHYVATALSEVGSSGSFLAGQLSFCTLLPKRAIPFKVVCLLGMNEGSYPLIRPPLGFDLMATQFQAGDRSRKDEERYLFLEAILAAEKKLYLSWIGRNIQDNSEKQPSILLSELLEYCESNYCLEEDLDQLPEESADRFRQFLLTQHPSQPFSKENFIVDSEKPLLFSYEHDWLPTSQSRENNDCQFTHCDQPFGAVSPNLPTLDATLSLAELKRFFNNPCQYFLKTRLQVDFSVSESKVEEHEPFLTNSLELYQIKQNLLESQLSALRGEEQHYLEYIKASGILPAGVSGEYSLLQAQDQVQILLDALPISEERNAKRVEIDILVGEKKIQDWLVLHSGTQYLSYKTAALRGKDYLYAWIDHLALYASGVYDSENSRLFGVTKKKTKNYIQSANFTALSSIDALVQIKQLTDIFDAGLKHPLPFFTETAWAWFLCCKQNELNWSSEIAWNAALQVFYGDGGYQPRNPEGDDLAIARIYPRLEEVEEDFKRISRQVFGPLYAHIEMEEKAL